MSSNLTFFQAVQPRSSEGQPGPAPSGGGGGGAPPPGGGLMMFLPLLVFLPIIFLSMRRQKKETEARQKLKKGDRVTSNSGLVGELIEMEGQLAKVKIAPGVTVQMVASTVAPFEAPAAADSKDAKVAAEKK